MELPFIYHYTVVKGYSEGLPRTCYFVIGLFRGEGIETPQAKEKLLLLP